LDPPGTYFFIEYIILKRQQDMPEDKEGQGRKKIMMQCECGVFIHQPFKTSEMNDGKSRKIIEEEKYYGQDPHPYIQFCLIDHPIYLI